MTPRVTDRVGIAWYSAEQYELLMEVIADRESMPDTHAQWLERAEMAFSTTAEMGVSVVRVPVDVGRLQRWCNSKGIENNGEARADFVAQEVRQMTIGGLVPPDSE